MVASDILFYRLCHPETDSAATKNLDWLVLESKVWGGLGGGECGKVWGCKRVAGCGELWDYGVMGNSQGEAGEN